MLPLFKHGTLVSTLSRVLYTLRRRTREPKIDAELHPMPENIVRQFVTQCYISGHYTLLVILTDGTPLFGTIEAQTWQVGRGLIPASELCFHKPGHLKFHHYDGRFTDHYVFVPLDQISGICAFPYEQKKAARSIRHWASTYFRRPVREHLFHDLVLKARAHSFPFEEYFSTARVINISEPFDWRSIEFSGDASLYSDWMYFRIISGGLNSIGAGALGMSGSAGWSKSLWSSFKNKVREHQTKLEDICSRREVVVTGFVSFVQQVINTQSLKKTVEALNMEGAQWNAGVICDSRVQSVVDLKCHPWALIYFRTDGFLFPAKLWEKIVQPVRIFAEVVPASVSSQMGQKPCFLKARAAAFLASD